MQYRINADRNHPISLGTSLDGTWQLYLALEIAFFFEILSRVLYHFWHGSSPLLRLVQSHGANYFPMKNDVKITTQMYQYRHLSIQRTVFEILFDWSQLFLLLALFLWSPSLWTFLLVFILIGAVQYNLLVLLHDAQHAHLSSNRKINDLIATWFLAAPFGVIFSKSRLTHMQHHQHLGISENDPDFPLYCTGDPEPKDTVRKFVLHFLRQIFWAKLVRVFLPNGQTSKKTSSNVKGSKLSLPVEVLAVLICQMIIFLGFALVGYWHAYFYLWILPLMTIATFLNDARIFCEHSNPQDGKCKNKSLLVSYLSNPLERFFFGPHHMNYHAEHHFFPFIPHYYLPKVRRLLQTLPEYQCQIQWRQSYWSHIKEYLRSISSSNVGHSSNKPSSEII